MASDTPPETKSGRHPAPDSPQRNPVLWWSTMAGMAAVMLFGAIFVPLSYRKLSREQANELRPPYLARLVDFKAVNRDGQPVNFAQLEGKIWVAGYQRTDLPADDFGVAAVMQALNNEFGQRADFHLVSISLNPREETPEILEEWVKSRGLAADNWWFLTGDEQRIRDYMIRSFKFTGVAENTDPADVAKKGRFSYDRNLALVDGDGMVRGRYDVMEPVPPQVEMTHLERLQRDIRYLLDEIDQANLDKTPESNQKGDTGNQPVQP